MSPTCRCPQCGAVLPGGSPLAPCPACLMQLGLTAGHDTPIEPGKQIPGLGPTHVPTPDRPRVAASQLPQPAELSALFPELEIIRLLGHGGMGAVYQARQTGLDRYVALKIIMPEVAGEPGFAERFVREARVLARLNHPHIVTIHDFGQRAGLHYLIMEHVDGINLRDVLSTGRMTPAEALRIIPPLCDALQYAHEEGVVHRDIKPENILVDRKGRVKIADFGLARLAGRDSDNLNLTGTRQVVGTPRYMAPEQMQGARAVDHRVDLYSLGVVFYEMLTGEVPMGRFPPPSHHVPLDTRLDDVVLRALESDPNRRYQRASDIKTDVETISHGGMSQNWPTPLIPDRPAIDLTAPAFCQLILGAIQIIGGLAMISMSLAEPASEMPLALIVLMAMAMVGGLTGCLALAAGIRFFASGSVDWLRWGAVGLMLPTSIAWILGMPVGVWTLRVLERHRRDSDAVRRTLGASHSRRQALGGRPPELTILAVSLLFVAVAQLLLPLVGWVLLSMDGEQGRVTVMGLFLLTSILTGGMTILGGLSYLAGAPVGALRIAAMAQMVPNSLTWLVGFPLGIWTLHAISRYRTPIAPHAFSPGPRQWSPPHGPVRDIPVQPGTAVSDELSAPWSGLEWAQKAARRMSRWQKFTLGLLCGIVVLAALIASRFLPLGSLHQAARSGSTTRIAVMSTLGADIDGRDEQGMTPLMWAAWEQHPAVARQLVDRGADVNLKGNDGETALMKAAVQGNLPIVSLLLSRKASVNESDDDGETALLLATSQGHVSVVQVLLGHNADPKAASSNGATPLIAAAFRGHSSLVNLLLPLSQVDARDRSGETALMKASARGFYPVVEELLAAKANVNIANVTGHTAQRLAIAGGYTAIADGLADKGASLNPLYDFYQGFRAGRAGNYKMAADKLRSAAGDVTAPMPTPSSVTFDEWRYEITSPQIHAWILAGECLQRLGDPEAARAAWQMAVEKTPPGGAAIRLYRRQLDRPDRHLIETISMAPGEIARHLDDPKRAWHFTREYEDEQRGPGRSMGQSGAEEIDVPDLFK